MAKNDTQLAAQQQSPQGAPAMPDIMLALDQERQKNAELFKEMGGTIKSLAEKVTVLQTQLLSGEPLKMRQAAIVSERVRPGVLVMSDGKRIVLSHVATYGPLGKTSVQLRARDGSILATETAPTHRNNEPVSSEEQLKIVEGMMDSLDELFGVDGK